MTIRVRVTNGVLVPLEPLPAEWKAGEVVRIRPLETKVIGKGRVLIIDPNREFRITRATIKPGESVSLEWEESNCKGELQATKSTGGLYRGTWRYAGFQDDSERGDVELTMFFANEGAVLLFGNWRNQKYGKQDFVMHILRAE